VNSIAKERLKDH